MIKRIVYDALYHLSKVPAVSRVLAKCSRLYLHHYENCNNDQRANGELWLLERLNSLGRLRVCFDVGANVGDWTRAVCGLNANAEIHSFEIAPATRELLVRNCGSLDNVRIASCGLGDQRGTLKLNFCESNHQLSSVYPILCSDDSQVIEVEVIAGKEYCDRINLKKIDFLKIDVEGAEMKVLGGFGDLLKPESIPVIQFEYGMVNIITKDLLKDFYEFFEAKGYKVGKLMPDHIRFKEYAYKDEDFMGPNYIAMCPKVAAEIDG